MPGAQHGDLLVTALCRPAAPADTFLDSEWPLHVTIVAWFRTSITPDVLAQKLAAELRGVEPFTTTLAGEEHLGFGGKALVNIVKQPTPFMDIQARTVFLLEEKLHVQMIATRGTWGGPYKPHVTVQANERMHQGEQFFCDALYLVAHQAGGRNKIVGRVPLDGAQGE